MVPFWVVFTILAILSFVDVSTFSKKEKQSLYIFIFILLVLFAGLRESSPDYENYAEAYKILSNTYIQNVEITEVANDPGYFALNRILIALGIPCWGLFLFIAFLSIGFNLYSYRTYTPYFFACVLLYFVHTYIGRELMQIRAGLACAICLYSVRYLISNNYKKFVFTVFIASTFHLVAICFLGAGVLCKLNISIRKWILIIVISFLIGLIFPLGQLIKLLPAMDLLERIQNYNSWEQYNGSLGIFTNPTVLKELFIIVLSVTCFRPLLSDRKFKIFFDLYAFSLCWLVLFSDYGIISARIATVFSIGEVVICSFFYKMIAPRSRWIYTSCLILFAFLMLFMNMYTDRLFEYNTIL